MANDLVFGHEMKNHTNYWGEFGGINLQFKFLLEEYFGRRISLEKWGVGLDFV